MRPLRWLSLALALGLLATLGLSGRSAGDWLNAVTGPRGWLVGIACGLTAAWLFGVEWRSLPERIKFLLLDHRKNLAWTSLAGASLMFLVAG
jgi:hypothetical protein